MSDKLDKPHGLAHPHEPESNPVKGHSGTHYEGNDVQAGTVVTSLLIVGGLAVLGFVLMIPVVKYLNITHPAGDLASPLAPDRVLAPAPQIQVHPWEDLPLMRAHENAVLTSGGKDPDGRVRIPIEEAMTNVVPSLKIEPNAPRGLTTPGGNGREFSKSLADMPAVYRAPRIEGEIRKNAQ